MVFFKEMWVTLCCFISKKNVEFHVLSKEFETICQWRKELMYVVLLFVNCVLVCRTKAEGGGFSHVE